MCYSLINNRLIFFCKHRHCLAPFNNKVKTKSKISNHYNQIPHPTQKVTKNTRKHHIQKSREVSPFQAGHQTVAIQAGHQTAARNGQDSMIDTYVKITNNKKDPQNSTALERSVFLLLEGLNMIDSTILTLISDVDQD